MIPCLCIDDINESIQFLPDSWIEKGKQYHIIDIMFNSLSTYFKLYEKPYIWFDYSRFTISAEHLQDWEDLVEAVSCPMDFEQLFKK